MNYVENYINFLTFGAFFIVLITSYLFFCFLLKKHHEYISLDTVLIVEHQLNKETTQILNFKKVHGYYPKKQDLPNLPIPINHESRYGNIKDITLVSDKYINPEDLKNLSMVDGVSCQKKKCDSILIKIPGGMYGSHYDIKQIK